MNWIVTYKADPEVARIADRHYNRQSVGSDQFMPPGSCVVFKATDGRQAAWGTSWPFAEYVQHAWAGAWINSLFRKECDGLASDFIRDAVAATRYEWPDVPRLGMVTFINPAHVAPIKVRGRDVWGYSYLKAGFVNVGHTKGGLVALQLHPFDMPAAQMAYGTQLEMALP